MDETTRWSSDVWLMDEHYVTEGDYGLHSSLGMHTGHEGQTTWQVKLYNVYRIQSSNGHRNSIGGVGVIYSHACHPDNQLPPLHYDHDLPTKILARFSGSRAS